MKPLDEFTPAEMIELRRKLGLEPSQRTRMYVAVRYALASMKS